MKAGPLFIFGTSLAGKSTLAAQVGGGLGWQPLSTDQFGRHLGRPWTGVPQAVLDFYTNLSDDAVHWFLRVHHDNIWPLLRARLDAMVAAQTGILEGAALRPEKLAQIQLDGSIVLGLWLDPDHLQRRIQRESQAQTHDGPIRAAIDRFTTRCLRENDALADAGRAYGFEVHDVSDPRAADALAAGVTARLEAA